MKNSTFPLFILCIGFCSSLVAQPWSLNEKLISADLEKMDNLGISVAISDSFMLAGAWGEDNNLGNTTFVSEGGAAYMFKLQEDGSWKEIQKLESPNAENLGYFGFYVAIDGDNAMVGAYNEDYSGIFNAGRVYTYHRNYDDTWSLEDVILSPDANNGDYFGRNLAVVGDFALIGSYNHDFDEVGENEMQDAGAAYLFKRETSGDWSLITKLVAPDREPGDNFGKYLDFDVNGLIIGALNKGESFNLFESGAIYGWATEDSLLWLTDNITSEDLVKYSVSDSDNFENFGWDVATSKQWAVIGKSSESDLPNGQSTSNVGAAYFLKWENGGWVEKQKVYASDPSQNAHFGRAIAIDGRVCVIGAGTEPHDENGNNQINGAGAAYVFELQDNGVWVEVQKLAGTHRTFNDLFAEDAVDVHGKNIVIGAWRADTIAVDSFLNDAGAVYVFQREDFIITSVDPYLEAKSFSVSITNPSSGKLMIRSDELRPIDCYLRLLSMDGKAIFDQKVNISGTYEVDYTSLPQGTYVLQLEREGYQVLAMKWIKH